MTLFKISLKTRSTDAFIIMRLSLLVLLTAITTSLIFVLYRDFYQTIVQAETVLVLKREVALKDLDMELFRKVQKTHNYKITSELPDPIPDPFATMPTKINEAANATSTPQNL